MRIGDFEVNEPLPEMADTDAFAMLSPWIDVGKVGSLVLGALEAKFGALEAARLARPGDFYDFTRYRPIMYLAGGHRRVQIPNTIINYGTAPAGNNYLFIHGLEPHAHGETYVDSMLQILQHFGVRRHCLIGGMYDSVPHTRPLLISGGSTDPQREKDLGQYGLRRSNYQGPTTVTVLLAERAATLGIETMTLLVRLPNYAQIEEDYMGAYTVLRLLSGVFGLSMDAKEMKRLGEEQYRKLDQAIENNSQAKDMVKAMETTYDTEAERPDDVHGLSPEVEKFLHDIDKGFNAG